jgi:thiamine-phosphate pyrophosphorylase
VVFSGSFPPLYCIVDDEVARRAGWRSADLARAYLDGGARLLQIRAKQLGGGALLSLCEEVVELAHGRGASVIVNDRADVARLSLADGVHVGQQDVPVPGVRAVVGRDVFVGLSTHDEAQVTEALGYPISYVAVGPVYRTGTKTTGYDQVGLDLVRFAAAAARKVAETSGGPPVAIGGITLDLAADVLSAGASTVAVISDLLSTGDPSGRVRAFLSCLAR